MVGRMDEKELALYFFRKLVYVLYLEIGSLQPKIHEKIAEKADIKNAFFQGEKRRHASELYYKTEQEQDPAKILAPYEERTRLTLDDVQRAFVEGDWRNKFGAYNYGGPRWVRVAEVTQQLRDLIEQQDWEQAVVLIQEIKSLKTNQGYLVSQFERTERRRR